MDNTNSLLWRVSGKGLQHPSYFLGTMHLLCAEDAIISDAVIEVIRQVDQVYFEVDLKNMFDIVRDELDIRMSDGITLADLLTQDEYNTVRTFFEEHQPHYPFSYLAVQQPLMLSSTLYELFLPCNEKVGMDSLIMEEAHKWGKETKGLETLLFQSNLLNVIPYQQQARELLKTIENIPKYKEYFNEMITLYKEQDIEKLHLMTTREEAGITDYTSHLLDKRNTNWVEQFPAIAREKQTLFAVGAGHLGGEDGVLNLLRALEYTLHPIHY